VAVAPASFGDLSRQFTAKRPAQDFDLAFRRNLKPFPPGYLEELSGWSRLIPFLDDPAGIQRQLDPACLLDVPGPFLSCARLDSSRWRPPSSRSTDCSFGAARPAILLQRGGADHDYS